MVKMSAVELQRGLDQFCCTEQYWKLGVWHRIVCTDGVKFLVEKGECYWLVDLIASMQPELLKDRMLQGHQFWTVRLDGKGGCDVICERDTGDVAWRKHIDYTDFTLEECRIWVEGNVALLPGEH